MRLRNFEPGTQQGPRMIQQWPNSTVSAMQNFRNLSMIPGSPSAGSVPPGSQMIPNSGQQPVPQHPIQSYLPNQPSVIPTGSTECPRNMVSLALSLLSPRKISMTNKSIICRKNPCGLFLATQIWCVNNGLISQDKQRTS